MISVLAVLPIEIYLVSPESSYPINEVMIGLLEDNVLCFYLYTIVYIWPLN